MGWTASRIPVVRVGPEPTVDIRSSRKIGGERLDAKHVAMEERARRRGTMRRPMIDEGPLRIRTYRRQPVLHLPWPRSAGWQALAHETRLFAIARYSPMQWRLYVLSEAPTGAEHKIGAARGFTAPGVEASHGAPRATCDVGPAPCGGVAGAADEPWR